MNLFSRCSAAMYSPCASLNMFLMRSTTLSVPAGVSSPTSPEWKNPSESALLQHGHQQSRPRYELNFPSLGSPHIARTAQETLETLRSSDVMQSDLERYSPKASSVFFLSW